MPAMKYADLREFISQLEARGELKRIAAEGHTIGYHTYTHANLAHIAPEAAVQEIDRGIAGVEMALHGVSTTTPSIT